MATIPDFRTFTDAVVDTLEDAGLTVGRSQAPAVGPPHVIVYGNPSQLAGPLNDPHADGQIVFRVVSVGVGPEQAEWVAGKVREALLPADSALRTYTEAACWRVALAVTDSIGGALRDDDVQPSVFFCSDAIRFFVTPSGGGS